MPIVASFGGLSAFGFGAFPGGDFEPIATVTVGSGGASSIEFTSIPGTYQHLQVRGILKDTGGAPPRTLNMQLGNSTIDTGSNYAWHYLAGDGASVLESAGASQSQIRSATLIPDAALTSIFGAVVIDILDYASASKATTVRGFAGYDANGNGRSQIFSGLWTSTSAVDRIKIGTRSGFAGTLAQYSTAALYGVKA